MSVSLLVKVTLVGLFVASVLFVHFRGRARLPFLNWSTTPPGSPPTTR